ncbi:hypothetical protein BD779DRAFT_1799564 [Infundibulicybe gibba]|nr:hypothetical protein BD779DRAFT_1799564 [Infundibulicybe gibba]
MADAILPPFNPHATVGALSIGVLISTCLFGVVTVQTHIYSSRFPKDPKWLRILVPVVWCLELGHTIAVCHMLYTTTVTQYGQPQLLDIPPQSLDVAILLSGFIGPIEQGWFAHRIHKFSKSLYLPLFCVSLSALRFIGSEHWTWLFMSILVVGACNDVLLAASLCYFLKKWRRSGFERTARLIDHLILWTIETGLVTSVGAVALLVFFLTMHDNFAWIGMFTIIAKLFSNSLLASLNARPKFAQIYEEDMMRISTTPATPPTYPTLEMTKFSDLSQTNRSPWINAHGFRRGSVSMQKSAARKTDSTASMLPL